MPTLAALASSKAALVTGSTDGIGVTTAKNLAVKGYDVVIHGRDAGRIDRAKKLVKAFVEQHAPTSKARVLALPPIDISSVEGATKLASETSKLCEDEGLQLSVLMNNAGVYAEDHILTKDGLELTLATNVVATFVVTSLLLPLLLKNDGSRIVIASSISQCQSIRDWDDLSYAKRRFSSHAAYSESKLLDAMLTMELADRLGEAGFGTDRITCNCLDPGTVNTKMLLAGWGPCGINVNDALDQTWLCSSEEVAESSGRYYVYQCDRPASRDAYDKGERSKMWSLLTATAPQAASIWDTKL